MHPVWPNGFPSDANRIEKKLALQLACVFCANPFRSQTEVEPWDGASVAAASVAAMCRINVVQQEAISLIVVVSKENVDYTGKAICELFSSLFGLRRDRTQEIERVFSKESKNNLSCQKAISEV